MGSSTPANGLRRFARAVAVGLLLASIASGQREGGDGRAAAPLEVRVDSRIELVTIVARLAGFPEYDMTSSRSPYADEVESRFGALRSHAAVATLTRLRREHGVSYDALPSLAVHLEGVPALAERVPFEARPERLDARWELASTRAFLVELRDFAEQSGAAEFFEEQRPFYAAVEARLLERLSSSRALPWFDAFFGARPGARYVAIAGLLCGGGNFGVGARLGAGMPEEITPVFGCSEFDAGGVPVFGESYLPLFIHELCHSYTNPFVDRFERELAQAGERIHATCADAMQRQAYGTWKTMAYETLVRACVLRCMLATQGREAAQAQALEELEKHFAWVPELAKLLGEFETNRDEFATFEAFMPRVVEFWDDWAEKLAAAPAVVSMEPANGASDVDPDLRTLTIRFDRPMLAGSWSIVGASAETPAFAGAPTYDSERRVLTVPMRLERGRTYRFSLNGPTKQGFKSADGVPLAPLAVAFATRD